MSCSKQNTSSAPGRWRKRSTIGLLAALAWSAAARTTHAQAITPPRLSPDQSTTLPIPVGAGPTERARVLLELEIDSAGQGAVRRALELQSEPGEAAPEPFFLSATQRAQQLRFVPAQRDGQPVAAVVRLQLDFIAAEAPRRTSTRSKTELDLSPRMAARRSVTSSAGGSRAELDPSPRMAAKFFEPEARAGDPARGADTPAEPGRGAPPAAASSAARDPGSAAPPASGSSAATEPGSAAPAAAGSPALDANAQSDPRAAPPAAAGSALDANAQSDPRAAPPAAAGSALDANAQSDPRAAPPAAGSSAQIAAALPGEPASGDAGSSVAAPAASTPALGPQTSPDASVGGDAGAPADAEEAFGARAHLLNGTSAETPAAASDLEIEVGALRAVPRREAADFLTLSPGVVLANHSGIGHASGVFMRGFDASEGQDIEFRVDGMPINEPSNAHGHGYADPQFVIPEVIDRVRVQQGPFDVRQGDFAVAGSAGYELGVVERGLRAQLGYGSFDEQRALLLWAPSDMARGSFAALDLRRGDGFGPNRAHQQVSALARYADEAGPLQWSILAGSHALRYDSAGVIRDDAFQRRELPCPKDEESQFFCLQDPRQGGSAHRHLLNGRLSWRRPDRRFQLQVYGMLRGMRAREDFTGALVDPRGDGLDEGYATGAVGALGSYALTPTLWGRKQRFELGFEARHDSGNTRIWRLRRADGIPYATVFDTDLALTHVAGYARSELAALPWLSVLAGLRLEAFGFSTENRAAPAQDRVGPRLPLDARDAWGNALSPRGSVLLHVLPGFDWTFSGGLGVRSSDAQALSDAESAPFARVIAAETGPSLRGRPRPQLLLEGRAFAFATRVENDLLFDPQRGRNVPIGPSNRFGASLSARSRIDEAHDTLLSFTWSEAHRPARSASALDLASGPALPFVPRFVCRLDHASSARVKIGSEILTLGGALGASWIGPRPLPLGGTSDPVWQVDLSARARLRFLELGLSIVNLFDVENRVAEFNYASNLATDDDAPASMRATRHFAAGTPRALWMTLTAYFDDIEALIGDAT